MKPKYVENCKNLSYCKEHISTVRENGCKGCNIWNYLYDGKAFSEYCNKNDKNIFKEMWEIERTLL